jgi:uncharacterized membrane protein YoaT (DUF817 family)
MLPSYSKSGGKSRKCWILEFGVVSGSESTKMNFFSFLFVILNGVVELWLEVLNSCLFGILMLHSLIRLQLFKTPLVNRYSKCLFFLSYIEQK